LRMETGVARTITAAKPCASTGQTPPSWSRKSSARERDILFPATHGIQCA
jgi:hypothetical protein